MQGEWYEIEFWSEGDGCWFRLPPQTHRHLLKRASFLTKRKLKKAAKGILAPHRFVHVTPRGRVVVDG